MTIHTDWNERLARSDADIIHARERKLRAVVDATLAAPDTDGLMLRLFASFPRGSWQIEVGHTAGSFDITVTDGAGGIVGYVSHRSFVQALADLVDDRLLAKRLEHEQLPAVPLEPEGDYASPREVSPIRLHEQDALARAKRDHPSSRVRRYPSDWHADDVAADMESRGYFDPDGAA